MAGEPFRYTFPPGSSADLAQARRLREAIYRVFSTVASDGEPPPTHFTTIMTSCATALAAAQSQHDGSHFRLYWSPPYTVRQITRIIAASTAQLPLNGRWNESASARHAIGYSSTPAAAADVAGAAWWSAAPG